MFLRKLTRSIRCVVREVRTYQRGGLASTPASGFWNRTEFTTWQVSIDGHLGVQRLGSGLVKTVSRRQASVRTDGE
jgi:hypothetical protein